MPPDPPPPPPTMKHCRATMMLSTGLNIIINVFAYCLLNTDLLGKYIKTLAILCYTKAFMVLQNYLIFLCECSKVSWQTSAHAWPDQEDQSGLLVHLFTCFPAILFSSVLKSQFTLQAKWILGQSFLSLSHVPFLAVHIGLNLVLKNS